MSRSYQLTNELRSDGRRIPVPYGDGRPTGSQPHAPYMHKSDPWSSHSKVVNSLACLAPGANVLEVGVATGFLGQLLSTAGYNVYGIEPNQDWAEQASPYYVELFRCALENLPDYWLRGYDAVICADVLEHMVEPERALRRLVDLAPEVCRFVISVPNVANVWVRLNLLFGRFDYAERGILDRTHLRFFTRRTLLAMIATAGLDIAHLDATPIPLSLIHPFFDGAGPGRAIHACLNRLTAAYPTLLAYQFVVQAAKPTSSRTLR